MACPRPELVGLTFSEAAVVFGRSRYATEAWLYRNGYRKRDGKVVYDGPAEDVEDQIAARVAAAPPSAPCFLCGAARWCEHRPMPRAA